MCGILILWCLSCGAYITKVSKLYLGYGEWKSIIWTYNNCWIFFCECSPPGRMNTAALAVVRRLVLWGIYSYIDLFLTRCIARFSDMWGILTCFGLVDSSLSWVMVMLERQDRMSYREYPMAAWMPEICIGCSETFKTNAFQKWLKEKRMFFCLVTSIPPMTLRQSRHPQGLRMSHVRESSAVLALSCCRVHSGHFCWHFCFFFCFCLQCSSFNIKNRCFHPE